jgi:hypothetical protein
MLVYWKSLDCGWASDSSESPVENGGFAIPLLIGQPSQVVQDFATIHSRLKEIPGCARYFQRVWSAPGGIPVSARSRGRHHQHLLLGVRAWRLAALIEPLKHTLVELRKHYTSWVIENYHQYFMGKDGYFEWLTRCFAPAWKALIWCSAWMWKCLALASTTWWLACLEYVGELNPCGKIVNV